MRVGVRAILCCPAFLVVSGFAPVYPDECEPAACWSQHLQNVGGQVGFNQLQPGRQLGVSLIGAEAFGRRK